MWVGRAAFSWLLLLLQSRLVLLLQDGLLCKAAMQLLLRLATAAKLSLAASATKEEQKCDASRIAVVWRRANCKPNKPGVTRLEPHYAKEQPRLYSVQSCKGGVRDGRKLQKGSKNVTQIGA